MTHDEFRAAVHAELAAEELIACPWLRWEEAYDRTARLADDETAERRARYADQ
jgi:hypothetical protein